MVVAVVVVDVEVVVVRFDDDGHRQCVLKLIEKKL